ncbi:hypothetical protein ACSMXN_06660 [Jatrophihabitans sp. DSM 45814]
MPDESYDRDHEAPTVTHNTEINTAASEAELCGMTHLPTGRLCLLPKHHAGGCDFRTEDDVDDAISRR